MEKCCVLQLNVVALVGCSSRKPQKLLYSKLCYLPNFQDKLLENIIDSFIPTLQQNLSEVSCKRKCLNVLSGE